MTENKLKITEIFHSIQGESTLAGERFSFVRLTGCPLACTWCDTTYSFTGGTWMSIEEIVTRIKSYETRWVLVTGGEPLAQKNCLALVKALRQNESLVGIETSGEKEVRDYVGLAKIIMDIKTPSSGEKAEICFKNLEYLLATDEIKFVIQNENDYRWSKKIVEDHALVSRFSVLFSPVFDIMNFKTLSEWMLRDRLNVRLQIQLHKLIWGKSTAGV